MNTQGLLDQLLKSASGALSGSSSTNKSQSTGGGSQLGSLLSGAGGGALAAGAVGLLLGNKKARKMGGKAVKYGGTSEQDALKFVTLNPAKQLKIDKWVGSLETGKDADFVIWSGHPLSSQSVADETWIEGKQYYDRAKVAERAKAMTAERDALIAKARKKDDDEKPGEAARAAFFMRALEKAHQFRNCYECRKAKP